MKEEEKTNTITAVPLLLQTASRSRISRHKKQEENTRTPTQILMPRTRMERGKGVTGLMKQYYGKSQFGGGCDEDLDNCIQVFETLAKMCSITTEQMVACRPVMLNEDAMNYYRSMMQRCQTYKEAIIQLRRWYRSDNKKSRILAAWKEMTLSKAISASPS